MYRRNSIKTIKLPNEVIEVIAKIPEDGLGYHLVSIELKNGKILKNRLVTNCEFLILEEKENIQTDEIKRCIL